MNKPAIEELLHKHGQEHLLQFWDDLNEEEQASFGKELLSVDYNRIKKLSDSALEDLKNSQSKKDEFIECLPDDLVENIKNCSEEKLRDWYEEGLRQISQGTVAVLLLAGGQGTRLGVSYPKGMYNVDLPSGKTLYQLQAERIFKVQQLATEKYGTKATIKWYIMTSEATLKATKKFFETNNYFGLSSASVIFFEQHLLPCLTFEGKMMLASKGSLAQSPDGNGGLYRALESTKILKDMENSGIKSIYVYCVDNILVKVADPVFIGFCVKRNLECGNKVIEKVDPNEAVGVVCKCENKFQVVEYSEISRNTAEKRNDDGSLVFNASNICIHYFSIDFLQKIIGNHLGDLPHHVAKKKIPHINDSGDLVTPSSPNGMKLEKFVFDVFQFCSKFGVLEGERSQEFSPLKNGPSSSKCSPLSCKADLLRLHQCYLQEAGASFVTEDLSEGKESTPSYELSPLLSYMGEGLEDYNGKQLIPGKITNLEPKERRYSPELKKPKN